MHELFTTSNQGKYTKPTEMDTSPERSIPLIGDCIGCESCVEAMPLIGADSADRFQTTRAVTKQRRVKRIDHYPPPIPRMPWVLRRHYTSDGRLILREERVRHHEYFRAHRSGGRLTLQLVPLDDNGFDLPIVNPDDFEKEVSSSCLCSKELDIEDKKNDDNEKEQCSLVSETESSVGLKTESAVGSETESTIGAAIESSAGSETGASVGSDIGTGVVSGSGEWKCLYKTMSPSSSCIFGMHVHSLGPVLG